MQPYWKLRVSLWTAVVSCALVGGCHPKQPQRDAWKVLEQSFARSEAGTQAGVREAGAALQVSNYVGALTILNQLVVRQPLSAGQKQALVAVVGQVNKAVSANSALDTPVLYQVKSQLLQRLSERE